MTRFCPHCGKPIDDRPSGRLTRLAGAYKSYRQATFASTAVTPWQPAPEPARPAFTEAIRHTPARPQNLESDFLTPLLQALATGGFVGAGGMYLAWLYRGPLWYHGLACGVVAAGGYWLLSMAWNRRLLWTVEHIINAGPDEEADPGRPEPARIEVEVKEQGSTTILDLFTDPDNPAIVYQFIAAVVEGRATFSESGAAEVGYSATLFKKLRDEFVTRGVAYWKHPKERRLGTAFTTAGRAMLRELARLPYPAA